jgi:putative membrane protein
MVGASDKAFMDKAAEGGMMEVQLAQLAQRQSQNEQVKQLAQKIEQDHTAANKALTDIAQQRSVTLPTALGPAHQKEMDSLSKMSGADFDKAYVKMMVKDHKKDVKEFERASNNVMDSSLKSFASDTVPKLKDHLTTAESLQSGVTGTRARTKDKDTKDTKDTKDPTNPTTKQ